MKQKSDLKILLIQVREPEIRQHEFECVVECSGLEAKQIESFDVLTEPVFELSKLNEYDAIMIGGAGAYSVLDNAPFEFFLEDVARYCREKNIPYLGLCFGMQVAVKSLGGIMIHDTENKETGTYKMYRTSESDRDPVVGNLPKEFDAACGRQDRAERLPDGMVNLVYNDKCPFHVATYPNSSYYVVQFHPELWKKEDNLKRLYYYKEKYNMDEKAVKEMESIFRDAPESRLIITNFIQNIVLHNI